MAHEDFLGLQTARIPHCTFSLAVPRFPFLPRLSPWATRVGKHRHRPTENTLGCPRKHRFLGFLFSVLNAWFHLAQPRTEQSAPEAFRSHRIPVVAFPWFLGTWLPLAHRNYSHHCLSCHVAPWQQLHFKIHFQHRMKSVPVEGKEIFHKQMGFPQQGPFLGPWNSGHPVPWPTLHG